MFSSEHRDHVRPDLVCSVAIRGNTIRADHDGIDFSTLHHVPGHVVGNYGYGNIVFGQLPGGESQALKKRPRLVSDHCDFLSRVASAANDAECRAVITRGSESASVAMCEHGGAIRNQWPTMSSDGAICGDVFFKYRERFVDQRLLDLLNVIQVLVLLERRTHSFDGPKKVDRSRTSLAHYFADVLQVVIKIGH